MPGPRIAIAAAAAQIFIAQAAAQTLEARLTAPDPLPGDVLSWGLALDGDTLIGGAPYATIEGFSSPGRAIVFRYLNGAWDEGVEIRPSVIQNEAYFGERVAVHGDVVAAGAPLERHAAPAAGAVYVFERDGDRWPQVARLVASDGGYDARFGGALALQGETLLVGAGSDTNENGNGAGAVYVFERIGGVWTEVDKLIASDGASYDDFGLAIALDGDTALIGAPDNTHGGQFEAGAAYVFVKQGGAWTEQAKLVSPTPYPQALFGESLDISGDTAVVGAQDHPTLNLILSGAAWVFERSGSAWSVAAELAAEDAASGDHFAVSVAIEGDTILSGAYLKPHQNGTGTVYVFRRGKPGWTWDKSLFPEDPGFTTFGRVVALSDGRGAVAAPYYESGQGAAYTFTGFDSCEACDANCDGVIDAFDIEPFVELLVDPNATPCASCAGDVNGDGAIDAFDIEPFVACLTGP